jgi:outer membrane scaffolding protein for murein synthesis (MipA/OmpV family)
VKDRPFISEHLFVPTHDSGKDMGMRLYSEIIPRALGGFLVAGICLFRADAVSAQSPTPLGEWQYSAGVALRDRFEDPLPTWDVNVGLAASALPRYPGSNAFQAEPFPTLDVRYEDIAFLSVGEGLGVNVLRDKNYRVGFTLAYDTGRSQDDSPHLRGMGDIAAAAEPKIFAEYVIFPVVLRADFRRAIGGNDAYLGDLSVYMPVYGTEKFFIFAGLSTTYTDSTYQRRLFGVTSQQSKQSGYPIFTPRSGFASARIGSNLIWYWNDHWFTSGEGSIQRLLGDGVKSPITDSKLQLGLVWIMGYQF